MGNNGRPHGTDTGGVSRPPRRRGAPDLGHDGASRRRGAPSRPRRRHRRRARARRLGVRRPVRHHARLGPDGRAPDQCAAARHGARRDARVCRQRARSRDPPRPAGPGAVRPRRRRGGRGAARRDPARGAGRRAADLRRQRRLRAPRPREGPPRRRPRGRACRHPEGSPGDGAPRPARPRDPVRHPDLPVPTGVRPHLVRAGLQRQRRRSPTGDVRRYASQKRASMRAHASQASADGGADRTLAAFLRIPRPLFDLVFGREWYVDAGRGPPEQGVAHDVFD